MVFLLYEKPVETAGAAAGLRLSAVKSAVGTSVPNWKFAVTEVSQIGRFLMPPRPSFATLGPTPPACVKAVVWDRNVNFLAFAVLTGRDDFWIYASAGVAAGLYLFYRGFRTLQRKRLILDTPTSKIHSASMGLVEVSGLAAGPHTIVSPVTGLPCFLYHTIAWQLKRAGKSEEWRKVAEESLHVPFFLDDNTGRVLIDPQGAEMDLHRDFHQEFSGSFFGTGSEAPINVLNFLARHGVANDHKLKVDEYCIKPKNALFILGTLAANPGVEVTAVPVRTNVSGTITLGPNMPSMLADTLPHLTTVTVRQPVVVNPKDLSPQEVIRLNGNPQPASTAEMTPQGKIAAALSRAGITNPAAWAAAGVATASEIIGTATDESGNFESHPSVVLMKGAHDPAFFISWRSQKEIVRHLGWQSTAMIWGGPALTLASLYYIFAHFGWL